VEGVRLVTTNYVVDETATPSDFEALGLVVLPGSPRK
jgi:hypothetical protein